MTPRTPPAGVVRVVEGLRNRLERLTRRLVPGNIALLDLGIGAWVTQMLYVAAALGIPDQLADGPRLSSDVAKAVGADPDGTDRLMRALVGKGVLKQHRDGRFALTGIGQALRSGTEGSLRDMILFGAHPARWEDWGNLLHAVRTGETATRKLRGMSFFDYLDTDPELASTFNNAMSAMSALTNGAVLAAGDFGSAKVIVDVGGGHGSFLTSVLQRNPAARGVLYDREPVVEGAQSTWPAGIGDRCTVEAGSFFSGVPAGGDTYLLRNIVHDWGDDDVLTILRHVRAGIVDGGTLMIVEMVLPDMASAHFAELLNLEMLVAVGGRERTAAQYENLLQQAGFRLVRITPTASPMSIIAATTA
jgi:hypothetical protein